MLSSPYANISLISSTVSLDAAVSSYDTAVTTAGGSLNNNEKRAYNKFVKISKSFGVWPYIKDMCYFSGGVNGMFVKLVTHPSISGSTSMDVSAGTSIVSGNYGVNGGYVFKTGNVIKTRLTLANIPYNNFCFTHVRPANAPANNSGDVIFGFGNFTTNGTQECLGIGNSVAPSFYPSITGTQFGVPQDRINQPWTLGNFAGVHTINHYPVSGTRFKNTIWQSNSPVGSRDEDKGSNSFVNSTGEIKLSGTGEQYSDTYSMSGYCIADGLPDNLIEIYQNLLLQLHQDLGRNDLTYIRDAPRLNIIGDSYTAGLSASGVGFYFAKQIANNFNPNITFVGLDGTSGETISNYITLFDAGKFHYIDQYHLSSNPTNNYVLIELGTNDCGFTAFSAGVSAPAIKANMDALYQRIKIAGWRPICVTPVQSVNTADSIYTSRFNSNSPALIALIAADSRYTDGTLAYGILRLDQITELQNPLGSYFSSDGLHPNDAGHTIIANYAAKKYWDIANIGQTSNTNPISGYTVSDGFFDINGASLNGRVTEVGGKTWATTNNVSILNNRAVTTDNPSINAWSKAILNMSSSNYEIQMDMYPNFNSYTALFIRHQDQNNHIVIWMNVQSTPNYQVYRYISGTGVQLGTTKLVSAPGSGLYRIKVICSGNNFTIDINGVVDTFTDSNALSSNTGIGFAILSQTGFSNTGYVDNFSAK